MRRSSGILLHPTSLPGPYGIGDLGPQAVRFVDRLAEAGQKLWQVLPLGPTGYGDSPYAPFSTFAGNELLISPELLAAEGLLGRSELEAPPAFATGPVDYGPVITWKRALLEKAAARFLAGASPARRAAFEAFRAANSAWLPDYALFIAIKADYDEKARAAGKWGALWNNWWPASLALREDKAMRAERELRAEAMSRVEVLQFLFDEEWKAVKAHANKAGVEVIGDLPIFVAEDSADVWCHRELFTLDERGRPREMAGVPPDYFSADGQLWGNPLYDWEAHRAEGFAWWIARLKAALDRYDAVRIDHFRGFEAYWAVPAGEKTARNGAWRKAPGHELFRAAQAAFGHDAPIVAEDLGLITEEVRDLRDSFHFPGMRILEFAFDADESGTAFNPRNGFLPHNYIERTVTYTGTHDNDTLAGWLAKARPAELAYVDDYLGLPGGDHVAGERVVRERVKGLLREAWKSVAAWAIAPMQDILGLGSEARMNTPSTLGGNWAWRLREGQFSAEVAAELARQSRLYGRGLE